MSGLPDPDLLEASAARLAQHARAAREHAARLGGAAAQCRWDGPAARAFRVEADEVTARLRAAAHRLDTAADALRRHAVEVRAELDARRRATHLVADEIGVGR